MLSLEGDALIAVPLAWHAVGYLIFLSLAATLAFLWFASYDRVETVSGAIEPDLGVSAIIPTRAGVITSIAVRPGQEVQAGAELAGIRAEEDSAKGPSVGTRIADALNQQDVNLAQQINQNSAAAAAQYRLLAEQQAGLGREIAELQTQVDLQEGLINSAQEELEQVRPIAARGFVSGLELRQREESLISRQQNLAAMRQTVASKRAAIAEAARSQSQIMAQANSQNANTASLRAQVIQQLASASGTRSYVLRAPVAGRVASLIGRVGQAASPQTPLLTIVPRGATLRAELAVPTSAIGFIKPRQKVHLAVDAFPYQKFGTLDGRVLTVATSAINQPGPNGSVVPVYPVTVELAASHVAAFGREEPLVPGMTLSARVITERQSLLQWLFEPIFAVRQR